MKLIKSFLAIGIMVFFAIFVCYGLYVVYEAPVYSYQPNDCYKKVDCDRFMRDCQSRYGSTPEYSTCYQSAINGSEYRECQELLKKCNKEFEKQTPQYKYSRNSFFILITIGLAALIAGIFLSKMEGIGSGFLGGGILVTLWSLFYGREYWWGFNKYSKLAILGAILVILIYFGYRKMERRSKPTEPKI